MGIQIDTTLAMRETRQVRVEPLKGSSSPSSGKKGSSKKLAAELLLAMQGKVEERLNQSTAVPASPPMTQEEKENFLKILTHYMEVVLEVMVALAKNQSQINGTENDMATNFVKLSQQEQQKAESDYKKFEAAVEAQKHESFWDKLLGGLGMALGFAIGLVTGDIALCAMSVAMGAMMFSGGSDALNTVLQGIHSDILRTIVDAGIDVGIAGGISGLSGAIEANMVEDAIAAGVKEEAEEAGAEAGQKSFGDRAKAAMKGSFTQSLGMSTMIVNPFTDFTASFIDLLNKAGANISKENEKLISEIVGMLMAFAAAAVSVGQGAANRISSGIAEKMTSRFGEGVYDTIKMGLTLGAGGFNIGASVMTGLMAKAQFAQADVIEKLGGVKEGQQVYDALMQLLNDRIKASLGNYNDLMGEFSQISQRWNSFVKPAAVAARGMN